jgi:probable HAF family extracellular repeat protein
MSDPGTLGGITASASAINNAGQVVGYATDTNEVANAFLYDGTNMVNLSNFIPAGSGWTNLLSADAINDAGQIAGSGYLADGSYHAYLLLPATPLTIAITNPAPNASFQAPATFVVGASVSDSTGTVTNVLFLANSSTIGQSTTAPYGATASNLSAGTYLIKAVAFDNTGLTATNSISVTVSAVVADVPPTVSITNPAPNTSFQAPATFSVGARASDSDGTVTNVEFLVNSTVIGHSTAVPYAATANSLGAGTYSLTAIAFDNAGLTGTNSITITVTNAGPAAITILNPAFSGSSFSFSFATQVGRTYEGQSVNLLGLTNNWFTFTNVTANGSVVRVTDSNLSSNQRFYRVTAH